MNLLQCGNGGATHRIALTSSRSTILQSQIFRSSLLDALIFPANWMKSKDWGPPKIIQVLQQNTSFFIFFHHGHGSMFF